MKKIMVAGPWIGEFGYELFRWQGYLRHCAHEFDHIVVAGRNWHNFLYQDFCTDYRVFDTDINPCEGRFNRPKTDLTRLLQRTFGDLPYMTAVNPLDKITDDRETWPQEFVPYGHWDPLYQFHVVIHARDIQIPDEQAMVPDHVRIKMTRNWDPKKWDELGAWLYDNRLLACSIGCKEAAAHVPGTADLRGMPLFILGKVLRGSRMIVGPSSGPIHFATLCECAQVVWGSPHLEMRYKQLWNPFGTHVSFLSVDDQWDPPLDRVTGAIQDVLR